MYFINPTALALPLIRSRKLGFIDTPRQGNTRPTNIIWCADNGCYTANFDSNHWWRWLHTNQRYRKTCWFATLPDVVGDAELTLRRSAPWFDHVRKLGYRTAFVAQDGIENIRVPWSRFDTLFIGGSTEFKLGNIAREHAERAIRKGKKVHMGRVNSFRRFSYAHDIGCTSVDGTYLTFGPEVNMPKLLSWIEELKCAQ